MFLNEITYVKEVPTNKVLEAVTHFPGPHPFAVGGDGTIIPSQDCVLPNLLAELIFGLLLYPHSDVTKMPFWHH